MSLCQTSARLQWTPREARQALFRRTPATWSHYLLLGMARHLSFTAERAEDWASAFLRGATYAEREQLAAQDYLDQLDREREAYAA